MHKSFFTLFSVLLLFFIGGCSAFRFAEPAPMPLAGTLWIPEKLENQGNAPLSKDADVRLMISPDNKVNGAAGDNYFFGGCSRDGKMLKFNPIGVTRRAGPNQIYEQRFLEMLNKTVSYQIAGNRLELFDAKGKKLAVFVGQELKTDAEAKK